ncbi:GNAT family N-acetyltransferase [Clostridium sp. UBA4548]|uniref:GNAT family N-acetyltransferase n=1 Tax=Clostridium sp. UBA4548 TaxID=1946361 RepID=UPI0025BC443F|nr:GNAT family N-acetyltransferase [Clostridium sp. UBA4548]
MELIKCTMDNLLVLAKLNKELYEDEKNDNIPEIEVLQERLKYAMEQGAVAFLFLEDKEVVGYALVRTQATPYYLSHFFICRNARRKHLGTIAFNQLMKELETDSIDLDVFCWNQRGQEFWKSLGFKERCIIMRKSN